MPERLRTARRKKVGAKQTLKAIETGLAEVVYVARDADDRVTGPVTRMAEGAGIEIVSVESMKELGRLCGIEVGAASAAVLTG